MLSAISRHEEGRSARRAPHTRQNSLYHEPRISRAPGSSSIDQRERGFGRVRQH